MPELLSELLERCRQGESSAIAVLVTRFQPWAIDFATALLNDAHLAEDAVQSAYIAALGGLHELREPQAFPGWFRQIIRTQANRIARNRREMRALDDHDRQANATSPVGQIESRERARIVHEALKSLPRPGRETAELFYLEELDTAQIAERLSVPRGTVKRRLHDARTKLRESLRRIADPPPPM